MNAPLPSLAERVRGCLLAGACGDALGAPVEFLSAQKIRDRYGDKGIRDFVPCYGRTGAISDDTQMTLFTAEGLLRAYVRTYARGIGSGALVGVVHHAYLRWLMTQGEQSSATCIPGGWLFKEKEMHSRRAPGRTCIEALRNPSNPHQWGGAAKNNSKGCGGVMRIAPVGLFVRRDTFEIACNIAGLTHGHPTGQIAAGFLAQMILFLKAGKGMETALEETLQHLSGHTARETREAVNAARDAAKHDTSGDALESLGEGWIAEEALAIALYSVLTTSSLEDAVIRAVNHGGDSDSTGSIAGHIAGVFYGEKAIPQKWLEKLELRSVIETLADDLHKPAHVDPCGSGSAFEARYPGY